MMHAPPTLLTFVLYLPLFTGQSVITTVQGKLRGILHDGYVSYKGIPYATLNGNDGRFEAAGLAPLWPGIRDSHEVLCSPASRIEDCLQLDVHVPSSSGNWPVLAWITGGSGNYNPRLLVQNGIIVVILYHRLGPLGFLCLGEEKIPGNASIKDVILALRWIRDNIGTFNGNPAHVVVGGQSLGAAMAEAVMLSPMATGLYTGVILQSGTVLAPWAFNYDAIDRAMKLAELLPESNNLSSLFLNTKIGELIEKSDELALPYFPFGVCVEKALKNGERLLSRSPFDLLSSNRVDSVPMMIGYNSDEAYVFASILQESRVLRTMSRAMSFLLPDELKFFNDREMNQVVRQIEDMYFKQNRSMKAVMAFHRDAYFVNHIHRSVRFHAQTLQPVYYYQFSYSGDVGVQEEPGVKKMGAVHSDELAYLFSGRQFEENDASVQRNLLKLWTNFVKYLNPTHKDSLTWDYVDPEVPRVLDIGTEPMMRDFPHLRAVNMWNDIYEKYYYSRNRAGA